MTRKAVVVGANGIIGGNLIAHLVELGDWEIVGLSRRGGETAGKVSHIAVDLLDAADAKDETRPPHRHDAYLLRGLSGPAELGRTCAAKPRHAGQRQSMHLSRLRPSSSTSA